MEELDRSKLARLAWMFVALLDETRLATLDDHACERLASTVRRALAELGSALPDELIEDLASALDVRTDSCASQAELLMLEGQVVGWLRGTLTQSER